MLVSQQRPQGRPNPSTVRARQIAAQNGRIHLACASGIPGDQLAPKLPRRTVGVADPPPRHAQLPHPVAGRQGAVDGAVAIACPPGRALVAPRSQRRRELGLEHRLDRLAHLLAQLLFKVLPKCQHRRMGRVVRATLLHGVPPSPFARRFALASREVTPFCFFYKTRDGSTIPVPIWSRSRRLNPKGALDTESLCSSVKTDDIRGHDPQQSKELTRSGSCWIVLIRLLKSVI